MNNSICVAKYRDKNYRCECAPGYTGKLCDIGNGLNKGKYFLPGTFCLMFAKNVEYKKYLPDISAQS